MERNEKWKDDLVFVVENYPLPVRTFITVTHALDVSEYTMRKNVNRFLMKQSKYSGAHVAALCGMEVRGNHQHAHLVFMSEKPVQNVLMRRGWKHGRFYEENYDLTGELGVKLSSFYALNHPETEWYADYCPNPRICSKPLCVHRDKFHSGRNSLNSSKYGKDKKDTKP